MSRALILQQTGSWLGDSLPTQRRWAHIINFHRTEVKAFQDLAELYNFFNEIYTHSEFFPPPLQLLTVLNEQKGSTKRADLVFYKLFAHLW